MEGGGLKKLDFLWPQGSFDLAGGAQGQRKSKFRSASEFSAKKLTSPGEDSSGRIPTWSKTMAKALLCKDCRALE